MSLRGQQQERGYAMAALLVALAVMSVLMSAALPAWRHHAQREKEAELIFRGEQYVRAIGLWERKMGPGSRPPSFDVLVQQKFLRKKYKDPMTADGEFLPIYAASMAQTPGSGGGGQRGGGPGGGRQSGPQGGLQAPAGGLASPPSLPLGQFGPGQTGVGGGTVGGGVGGQPSTPGIFGVVSKSKETSIRVYNGRTRYDEWQFIHGGAAGTPGGGGRGAPGGIGAPMPPGGPGRGRMGPGGGRMGPGGGPMGPGRGGPAGPGGRGTRPGGQGGPGSGSDR